MQLADVVCILEKEIKYSPQDIDHSTIQPHFLYNRLWAIAFTFLCPDDQSWTIFLFTAGTFPSLVFLIANQSTSCIDSFWPSECTYNWEYLSIYWSGIVASFAVGTYHVMLAWEWVRHFSTESKLYHQLWSYRVDDMVYINSLRSPYVLYCCYLLPCYVLQRSREATTWNRFQSNWNVETCFEYGVFSLDHGCLHAECYRQLWIIVYLFNVRSFFDVSATVLTQLQLAMWLCKQDHAPLLTVISWNSGP